MSTSSLAMLEPRGLWSRPPPAARSRIANNPTLLYSWWCTLCALFVIITRLCGRKVRSGKLFREDWIMMAAVVPLLARQAFIHVVLIYGTNNTRSFGLSEQEIYHRSIGARLVLAARLMYALFIWMSKLTISEFLKRITIRIWRRSYEIALRGIRLFLIVTFCIVVIATLCECQPFDHYWQVVPDPGPHCRLGYGNLLAMGICDAITDILLIVFPIPIIANAGASWRRKVQLASLFGLSAILIIITLLRAIKVIEKDGLQQYRTVWASSEILASTAVANTVIIGSFLRDKGTRKNKFRSNSVADSIDRGSARRPTLTALQNTGSDEDLFRFLGIRVPEHLQEPSERGPRPAPAAEPASTHHLCAPTKKREEESRANSSDDDSLQKPAEPVSHIGPSPAPSSGRLSFFDVGGLLEEGAPRTSPNSNSHSEISSNGVIAHDFAPSTPSQSRRASRAHDTYRAYAESRRGSRNTATLHLQDFGGLLTPTTSRASSGMERYMGRRQSDSHIHPPSRHMRPAPIGVLGPMLERHETQQSLQDAGGLLDSSPDRPTGRLDRLLSDSAADDIITPDYSRPRVRQPHGARAEDDIEMSDLIAVLSASRRPDAAGGTSSDPHSVMHPQNGSGWEAMDIQDPGGLLTT